MRVLLIGPTLLMPWTTYTARALERLGQEVTLFYETSLGLDRLTLRKGRALASHLPGLTRSLDRWRARWHQQRDQRLLATVKKVRPELILVLWGETFSEDLLKDIRSLGGCPLVTWWNDDPFRRPLGRILTIYDLFFVFDRSYIPRLTREGVRNTRFLPCACDETVYRPRGLTPREWRRYRCDISMVGWYYPRRAEVVQALKDLDLSIWGKEWTSSCARAALDGAHRRIVRCNRFVSDEVSCAIYNASKIGLNIHSHQTREAGLNTRSFELLAAGTFQLMDAVPGMEELLTPGEEVAVYRSPQEARELAIHYLDHPGERLRIAARGRARVLGGHTYLHRMQTLLKEIDVRNLR